MAEKNPDDVQLQWQDCETCPGVITTPDELHASLEKAGPKTIKVAAASANGRRTLVFSPTEKAKS